MYKSEMEWNIVKKADGVIHGSSKFSTILFVLWAAYG